MESINRQTHAWCENHNVPSHFADSIDSTNTWSKNDFKSTDVIAVFLADDQTHGRGRGARTWTNAAPGATWLSTWCLRLEQTPQPIFSMRAGLLLSETLAAVWPQIPWAVKAPNDIYVGDGKFAGILIEVEEGVSATTAHIGVGANIGAGPAGIDQATFSLSSAGPELVERWPAFLNQWVKGLFELRKDAHRSRLTVSETTRLKEALGHYPFSQIQEVLADGGLILKNGDRRHWNEL